ncbi:DUF1631 family protein [Rhodoferax sp.]|uniref:DUF1631 family protein n=1 Tax=Rhodoferax sp. TaxID=50421 RepID=UPI0025F4D74A|nr:DUF1631 family protein [Rhodoferax sp.]
MASNAPSNTDRQLARTARESLVTEVGQSMGEVSRAVAGRLTILLEEAHTTREMHERQDAWTAFQRQSRAWEQATAAAWYKTLHPVGGSAATRDPGMQFELMGDDVVENKIMASRLAQFILDKLGEAYGNLCARIQLLESSSELANHDPIRPEVLMLALVEQWTAVGLARNILPLVTDALQRELANHFVNAFETCNSLLLSRGVIPTVDLRSRVKRSDAAGASTAVPRAAQEAVTRPGSLDSNWNATRFEPANPPAGRQGGSDMQGQGFGDGDRAPGAGGQRHAADETRMMTAVSPLARARRRAQGVMGHLKRMLNDHVSDFDTTEQHPVSPALAQAIARKRDGGDTDPMSDGMVVQTDRYEYGVADVSRAASVLRDRSNVLKQKAATQAEKATIEVVALMFQSILAEERIPPSVRVWFARLQLPVLRVALAEPEFFSTVDHPARQLIDRMGSCVMGFDARAINGSAMEAEIRRVVQVIEQYPETGRRVFQLVFDEFVVFLSKFLTEKGSTQRLVSLAQQVEQKETLAIQYTIELRNMLKDMPVREEIRAFLFKVWAEVLAMAAVRNGAQHEDTVALKKAASELVWSASAKPNRADRAKVIQSLPTLLQRLRQGMGLLGLDTPGQEAHIKTISDTLADAFMSKTEAIPQARIDSMAAHLANLEDFFSDEATGDLPLDPESIEMMLGMDASTIDVIADGGSKPTDAMLAWAQELQLGHWFMLDHNRQVNRVQFAWRSERKQLHLFAAMDGRSYLIQARRLAAYLQAGLLVPQEEEALTLRATRDALAKLDANPERLLA